MTAQRVVERTTLSAPPSHWANPDPTPLAVSVISDRLRLTSHSASGPRPCDAVFGHRAGVARHCAGKAL